MQESPTRIKTLKGLSTRNQQKESDKYAENIGNQLEELSKRMQMKTKAKQQLKEPITFSLSKFEDNRPISKSQISDSNSFNQSSFIAESEDSDQETKRKLIYQSQSFKETDPLNQSTVVSNNQLFSLVFLKKSNYSETMSTAASIPKIKIKEETGISIKDFWLGKKLGSGKFGEVFVARHKVSGFMCAIKRMEKSEMDQRLIVQLIRQIKIQSFLNNPNIVKLYTFFCDQRYIYLAQQLCYSGQLYNFLKKKKKLPQDLSKNIVQQICRALDYMHECEIIHRDLKPENIIYHNGLIKICDFGWSISSKTMRQTFCGTPLYVSPELLKRKNYNNKIDVWSVGILTYQLLFGRVPFDITTERDFIKIVEDEIKFSRSTNISDQAKDFILICLKKDPRDRYTIPELLQHPFISRIESVSVAEMY